MEVGARRLVHACMRASWIVMADWPPPCLLLSDQWLLGMVLTCAEYLCAPLAGFNGPHSLNVGRPGAADQPNQG